jgi:hypothetical protein
LFFEFFRRARHAAYLRNRTSAESRVGSRKIDNALRRLAD